MSTQRSRPRWLRLVAGAALVAVPLVVAIPRWDTLLANNIVYPLTLAAALVVGLLLAITAFAVDEPARPGGLRRTFRIAGVGAGLGLAAILFWLAPFVAEPVALDALRSDELVTVTDTRSATTYEPAEPSAAPLVLYPGARVDPRAYAVLARQIAEAGSPVTVLKCPFDLSLICADPTSYLPDDAPWAIGGHSLGGVSASIFASGDISDGNGLIFWASYPLSDLSGRNGLAVTSIYGTQDGLTTLRDIGFAKADLPDDAIYVPIEGGIHAFFGDYGDHPGDGEPEISREEAQSQIVDATVAALRSLSTTS